MKLFLLLASFALQKNEVPVHYFYNSGWMVETEKHAIVFDFIPHKESGISIATLEGSLKKASSKNKKILVMISHDHQDHFDSSIFQLATKFKHIEFVLGWNYAAKPSNATVHIVQGTTKFTGSDYIINTHPATDDGVAFLLEIGGLTIYHGGDHALWDKSLLDQFAKDIMDIRAKVKNVDIAFLPAARGMFTQCAYDTTIAYGLRLSREILSPKVVALQHVGCNDKLSVYEKAFLDLRHIKPMTGWIVPKKFYERFTVSLD